MYFSLFAPSSPFLQKTAYKLTTEQGGEGSSLSYSINPIPITPYEKFSANAKLG